MFNVSERHFQPEPEYPVLDARMFPVCQVPGVVHADKAENVFDPGSHLHIGDGFIRGVEVGIRFLLQ